LVPRRGPSNSVGKNKNEPWGGLGLTGNQLVSKKRRHQCLDQPKETIREGEKNRGVL